MNLQRTVNSVLTVCLSLGDNPKYWISTLPLNTRIKALIKMAKHRWIIERDYQELKQELLRRLPEVTR